MRCELPIPEVHEGAYNIVSASQHVGTKAISAEREPPPPRARALAVSMVAKAAW